MKKNYLDQLTWLRGIAAFFVIVSHTFRATEVKYAAADEVANSPILGWLDLGNFGVVLFFVLSGCTLYLSNSNRVGLKRILSFYIKRVFRIWPAFFVSLVIYMSFRLVFKMLYGTPEGHWIESQFLDQYSTFDVLSYAGMVFNFTGPPDLFNNAYWSLPVEFQYYLIFPVIVFSLHRLGMIGPIAIGLALYFVPKLGISNKDQAEVFLLALSFCGGVVTGYFYQRSSYRIRGIFGGILLIILLAASIAVSKSYIALPDVPFLRNQSNWLIGLGILAVLVASITEMKLNIQIEEFMQKYGTISYSTYLYHNLFVATATLFMIKLQIHDSSLRLFGTFLFTLITSYIAAIFSYRYIEKPFIDLGRKLVRAPMLSTDKPYFSPK